MTSVSDDTQTTSVTAKYFSEFSKPCLISNTSDFEKVQRRIQKKSLRAFKKDFEKVQRLVLISCTFSFETRAHCSCLSQEPREPIVFINIRQLPSSIIPIFLIFQRKHMALTLRSSTSFINLNDNRNSKTPNDFTSMVGFPQMKPSFQLRVKNSTKEAQFSPVERTSTFSEGRKGEQREKLHGMAGPHSHNGPRVPVFVMLPLDTVSVGGNLNKPRAMFASLMALKSAGVDGVMVDAWWGLVEKDGPMKYNWEGYAELINMVGKLGLKLQVVMSFHQCGGNVGDSCR